MSLRPRYKKPWFHRERYLLRRAKRRCAERLANVSRHLTSIGVDPVGHLIFWRRRAVAAQWLAANRSLNENFSTSVLEISERLAGFAWYAMIVNIGMIVAAGSWLGNYMVMSPDSCERRHFILDNERAIIGLMMWQLIGAAFGLICAFAPQFSKYYRIRRRLRHFPHRAAEKQSGRSANRMLLVQILTGIAAAGFPLLMTLVFIVGVRITTADGMGREWAKYQIGCQREPERLSL